MHARWDSRPPQAHECAERGDVLRFPERTKLFDSDQPCNRVYLLRSGRVRPSTDHKAIIDHPGPGDVFAGVTYSPRAAESVTPTTVEAYRRPELLEGFSG
jgi:CRP-like cAMP-binding protein